MMGIILLIIPLGFLVVGIMYFSITLWRLIVPKQEHSSQDIVAILQKNETASFHRIGVVEKDIETLNTKILSDEDIELLIYAIYIKGHNKVVEMHNIEMQLKQEKFFTQEFPIPKIPQIAVNEVVVTKPIRNSKSKEKLLWVQN